MRPLLDRLQSVQRLAVGLGFLMLGAALAWAALSSSVWIGSRFGVVLGVLASATWLGGWWYANRRMKATEVGQGALDSATSVERLRARR